MMVTKQTRSESKKKYRFSKGVLSLTTYIIFSIGFIPFVACIYIIKEYFWFHSFLFYFALPFFMSLGLFLLLLSQMFLSGLFIKLFRVVYEPGTYSYEFGKKNAFKWMLIASLYTPIRKMLEIIPLGSLKNSYLRLIGMKIGKNTLVGGVIKDPCVTKIGDHTTIGEYAIIYGHIHNNEKGTILIDHVTIGNNCVIGAGAIIMPGAVVKDHVRVAAGALVTKKQILESGNTYVGIPATKH